MQLRAAYSDHASASPNQDEVKSRRKSAIKAYEQLIDGPSSYFLAYEALGVQQALLLDENDATKNYDASLQQMENAPAHMDRGLSLIHGRRDSYVRLPLGKASDEAHALRDTETEFRDAIQISPNYWDAHARLAYVLFEQESFREAAEVLEVALAHDWSNRPLRRLLGSVLADSCQFDAAKKIFSEAYQTDVALDPNKHRGFWTNRQRE